MSRLRSMLTLIGISATIYGALLIAVLLLQRRLIYPRPGDHSQPVMDDATLDRIDGPHGRTVYALHVPAPPDAPTVVHFHGNGETLGNVIPLAWQLKRAGVGFYAVEYPGYGLASDFDPSETTLYADAEAALWHLHNGLGIAPESVVLQGQSLGSAVAAEMARRGHGARLILISPFTSIVQLARSMMPILPMNWLIADRYDTASKVDELKLPVLIIHGSQDEVVPVEMGQKLADRLPHARLHLVRGAHHNDLFVREGSALVERIVTFSRGEFMSGTELTR